MEQHTVLVLFTASYPLSMVAEPFIDTEIAHLASKFEKVIIVPLVTPKPNEQATRELPSNVSIDQSCLMDYNKKGVAAIRMARCFISKPFLKQIVQRPDILRKQSLKRLLVHISEAARIRKWVAAQFKRGSIRVTSTLLYTYWLDSSTTGIASIKLRYPEIKIISRAHGFDVYEERYRPQYMPFRNESLEAVDRVFVISEHGRAYLSKRYPEHSDKISLARLGVPDYGFLTRPTAGERYRIVSCSSLVPVKRVGLLVDGLAHLGKAHPAKRFEWVHLGSGPLEGEITEGAKESLPTNVAVRLMGRVAHEEVIDYYRDNEIDLFINVSEYEGVPVSIMEALCCGIPVVATAVGGTPEIVDDSVGRLLIPNPSAEDIANNIFDLLNDVPRAEMVRNNARRIWEEKCNADTNYEMFSRCLTNFLPLR